MKILVLKRIVFTLCCSQLLVFCAEKKPVQQSNKEVLSELPTSQKEIVSDSVENAIVLGVERMEDYMRFLKYKEVAIVANHTSRIQNSHLVDSLLSKGINIRKVFSPEHGFRGEADAGASVVSSIDTSTMIPIVSLYGKNKKPTKKQLEGVDVVIFDIQDVGARFYTYISTMHYVMEACAEQHIPFIVLDRPNPNSFYIDGPILEEEHSSFVGLHPVPVVHGMTVGEYAKMINGEFWLKDSMQCQLMVIEMQNYDHSMKYSLPIPPSPNLPNMLSIYLYPSLCFFEGTSLSVGRGTEHPFQQVGHPLLKGYEHRFKPTSMPGAKDPVLKNKHCRGLFFNEDSVKNWMKEPKIQLKWLLEIYADFPDKQKFFNSYFNNLAGNSKLKASIEAGKSAQEIRSSWAAGLEKFKAVRKKYLIYEDF